MESKWSDTSWSSHKLLAGCTSTTVKLWDPKSSTDTNLNIPSHHTHIKQNIGPRKSIHWNHSGRVIAYGGKFPFIVMQSGRNDVLGHLPKTERKYAWAPTATINCVRFAHNSLYLLAGSDEGVLYVINMKKQELEWSAPLHKSAITCMAISADKDTVACGSAGTVLLYSLGQGMQSPQYRASGTELPSSMCRFPTALAFSEPEGAHDVRASTGVALLAGASKDGNVAVWRLVDNTVSMTLPGKHPGGATGVGFLSSTTLFSCGLDATLCSTDMRARSQEGTIVPVGSPLTCLSTHQNGHHIAVGTSTGSMLIYDSRNLQLPYADLNISNEPLLEVAWQPIYHSSSSSRSSNQSEKSSTSSRHHNSTSTSKQQAPSDTGVSPVSEQYHSGGTPYTPAHNVNLPEMSPAPAGISTTPDTTPTRPSSKAAGLLGASLTIPSFADLPAETPDPQHGGTARTSAAAGSRTAANTATAPPASSSRAASQSQLPPSSTSADPPRRASIPGSTAHPPTSSTSSAVPKPTRSAIPSASTRYVNPSQTSAKASTSQQRPDSASSQHSDSYPSANGIPNGAADEPSTSGADAGRGTRPGGGGGRFLTEETFQLYNERMEERLQAGLHSIHLDMIRSFHQQQIHAEQQLEAVLARQDELDAKLERLLALMERSMQLNTSLATSWL